LTSQITIKFQALAKNRQVSPVKRDRARPKELNL